MILRRIATASGRTLNEVSEDYRRLSEIGQISSGRAREVAAAVRTVNEVVFQYYLIPREVRAQYLREELASDGV